MQELLKRLTRWLERRNLISPFSNDEVLDATTEDNLRENAKAVQNLSSLNTTRFATNHKIKEQLIAAKLLSSSFGDFELGIARHKREKQSVR